MNVRQMIDSLLDEYKASISAIEDGKATVDQQSISCEILSSISFYNNRLLLAGNYEIEGT